MYTIQNDTLEVTLLDPVADRERLGTRYSHGGYIFQITDARHGPLLTGPTYPDSFNVFDGQGIPDAFHNGPLRENQRPGSQALIPGIGLCDLEADWVAEYATWEVEQTPTEIVMRTDQAYQRYGFKLERHVGLYERTVRSAIRVENTGSLPVPIRWFPHPFFPQTDTDALCRFNIPVRFPENPGFELAESGFIHRKNWPWGDGYFQALDHEAHTNLVVLQRHPALGMIAATCSYVPDFFPIWGNRNTFSWEPYFEQTIAAGQEAHWWIDYDF